MNPLKDDSDLTVGYYNEEKFNIKTLKWHPVIDKLFWSIKLDDIKVNGVNLNLCVEKTCMVTPDSGTSLSSMPPWAMKQFYAKTY